MVGAFFLALEGGEDVGKPSKLNDERRQVLVGLLETGNRLEPACESIGITYRTHRNWYARGEAESERLESKPTAKVKKIEEPYLHYFHAIKKALAGAEIKNVEVVQEAAIGGKEVKREIVEKFAKTGELIERKEISTLQPPDWTAAAWWLERRMPHVYGRQDRLKVEMEVQAQLEQLFGELRGVLSPQALGEIEAYILSRSEQQSAEHPSLN